MPLVKSLPALLPIEFFAPSFYAPGLFAENSISSWDCCMCMEEKAKKTIRDSRDVYGAFRWNHWRLLKLTQRRGVPVILDSEENRKGKPRLLNFSELVKAKGSAWISHQIYEASQVWSLPYGTLYHERYIKTVLEGMLPKNQKIVPGDRDLARSLLAMICDFTNVEMRACIESGVDLVFSTTKRKQKTSLLTTADQSTTMQHILALGLLNWKKYRTVISQGMSTLSISVREEDGLDQPFFEIAPLEAGPGPRIYSVIGVWLPFGTSVTTAQVDGKIQKVTDHMDGVHFDIELV